MEDATIECPTCAAQGVIILGYDPMASATDSDVLVLLRDARGHDALPPNSSPADRDVSPA